jgi:hypothetical protein
MNVAGIIRQLGYTDQWLEWGFIDEAYLRAQYDEFLQSDDKNQEHYRCKAFYDFLSRKEHLTDVAIDNIFRLTDDGPDGCDLQTDRISELIFSGVLSDEQHFALGNRHPVVREPPLQKRYERETLLRQIRRTGLPKNFAAIQATRDGAIHLCLLEHPEVTRQHLQWLASAGANKSIRNRADALLRSKRFRER